MACAMPGAIAVKRDSAMTGDSACHLETNASIFIDVRRAIAPPGHAARLLWNATPVHDLLS